MIQEIDFRLDRLLFNLNALAELAEEQTSPKDFQRIVRSSLYMMMGNFSASKGAIFQFDNEKKIARSIALKGFEGGNDLNVKLQQKTIDTLTGCKTPRDLYNKKTLSLSAEEKADIEKIKAKVLMPLVVKDEFLGFITMGGKFSGEDYAKEVGLSQEETEGIRIAGLLPDMGKSAIDKSITNKDHPLTQSEFLELNS